MASTAGGWIPAQPASRSKTVLRTLRVRMGNSQAPRLERTPGDARGTRHRTLAGPQENVDTTAIRNGVTVPDARLELPSRHRRTGPPAGATIRRRAAPHDVHSTLTEPQYRKIKPPAVSAERMSPSPSVSVTASPTSRRRALRKSLSTQSGDAPQRASTAPACSSNHAKRHSF